MLLSHKESKALSREALPRLNSGQFWCILLPGDLWAIPGMVFSCLPQEERNVKDIRMDQYW